MLHGPEQSNDSPALSDDMPLKASMKASDISGQGDQPLQEVNSKLFYGLDFQ